MTNRLSDQYTVSLFMDMRMRRDRQTALGDTHVISLTDGRIKLFFLMANFFNLS